MTTTTLSQVVTRAASKITLASSALVTTHGHAGSITATVTSVAPGSGTPTGTVDFYDGAGLSTTVPLSTSGKAAFPLALLGVGSHSITAIYTGSTHNQPITSTALNETIT